MGPFWPDSINLLNSNRITNNLDCSCPTPITTSSPPCEPLQPSSLFQISSACQKRCKCKCIGDRWRRTQEEPHKALDIVMKPNAPANLQDAWFGCGVIVRTMYAGTAFLETDDHEGKHVRVESIDANGDTFNIYYAHLCEASRVSGPVGACQQIGTAGRTGDATGVHLHIDGDKLPLSCYNMVEGLYQPSSGNVTSDVMCKKFQKINVKKNRKHNAILMHKMIFIQNLGFVNLNGRKKINAILFNPLVPPIPTTKLATKAMQLATLS
jgi:hypothetical protein